MLNDAIHQPHPAGCCPPRSSLVLLTERPVRTADVDIQPLRLAVPVGGYAALDLELQVFEGTDVEVRLLTGMQDDSEEGWIEVDRFVPTSKDASGPGKTRKCFFPLLEYVRWEVLSTGNATFLIHGVGRRRLGFLPTQLEGCVLWLRADLGVTVVSGKVSDWKDRSGQGHHFTQATSASRPTYVSSHAGFQGASTLGFDGTDDRLLSAATFSSPGFEDGVRPARAGKHHRPRAVGTASTVSITRTRMEGSTWASRRTTGRPSAIPRRI